MATLGPNDLKQYALPSGWDAAEISRFSLRSGETYEALINDIAAALALQNGMLLQNPLVSGLVSVTEEMTVEYGMGVSNGYVTHTEYGQPDAGRGAVGGHMLPLFKKDRALGWTFDFLESCRRSQIDEDIRAAMKDTRDIWEKEILQRLFKSTYTTVGDSGKSYPVADAGTADSTYVPINYPDRATAFASSHTHLGRQDGITQTTLEVGVKHVWEHGYDAPFTVLVAQADIASWTTVTTMTGYIPRAQEGITYGSSQDLSVAPPQYLGSITTQYGPCYLMATARIPTTFWSVFKSFGPEDPRNPLRVRVDPLYGVGAVLFAGDHIRRFPLENALLQMRFGVGIGQDRCAAYLCRNAASSTYTDPTIV